MNFVKNICCALVMCVPVIALAQGDSTQKKKHYGRNTGDRFFNFNVSYTYEVPLGDLGRRFTDFSQLGFGISMKTHRNVTFGAHGGYMWGGRVKESEVLQNLMTSNGTVIDQDGGENRLAMSNRGYVIMGYGGKLFPLGRDKNRGLLAQGGLGYLQHRIAFTNFSGPVPQLKGDYRKGYERRTAGVLFHSFIGYQYMSAKNITGFYIGATFDYARTQPLANIDYSIGKKESGPRNDMMFGLRLVWMIPVPLTDLRTYDDF